MIGNEFDAFAKFGYVPTEGFYGRERIDLMSCLWDDNGTLKALAISTSGTVGFKYVTGGTGLTDDMVGLVWNATADNTDVLVKDWAVPQDFKPDSGQTGHRSRLVARIRVRKLDTTGSASDNADLALSMQASWHNPAFSQSTGIEGDGDTAINVLATAATAKRLDSTGAVSSVIPADVAADSEAGFRTMYVDIGAAMTDAQLMALKPGAAMTLKLYPNEAIGADLALELVDWEMVYTRHLVPVDKFRKAETA